MLALAGCGAPGLGEPANLGVDGADRIEVRKVVPVPSDEIAVDEADRLATGFGEFAFTVATITDAAQVAALVDALDDARYIDTGGLVYDLSNPQYEVVFFAAEAELARLGYYVELGNWGRHEVPGRWLDDRWLLLAVTAELPAGVVAD